jgi:hypothetical protein
MRGVIAALLFAAAPALATDDIDWYSVVIHIGADIVQGRPATLQLGFICQLCDPTYGFTFDVPVKPTDVITWSFGDGSPDVAVTGSARVTHTFPRGWYSVTAQIGGHVFRKRIFSAPVFVDPPSLVDFAAPAYVSEAAGAYVVHLTRSGNLSVASTIAFSLDGDTAWLTTTGGTVTFAPGETSKDISIGLVNDALYEGLRSVTVTAWSVDGAMLRNAYGPNVAVRQIFFSIQDDDTLDVRIDDIAIAEGNGGTTPAVFNVKLSAPAGSDLVLGYQLIGGTATAGEDYLAPAGGMLSIPAGTTSVPLAVSIVGDRVPEPDETFRLQVAWFTPAVATCTILNDDTALMPDFLRMARGTRAVLTFDTGNPVPAATSVIVSASSPGVVAVPSAVTLPAGSARIAIPLDALTPGEIVVRAAAGNVSAQALVDVVESTTLRVAPASIIVAEGEEETVHLSFAPPIAAPHAVTLLASGPGAISFPSSVVIPAGGSADVTLRGTAAGLVAINVSAADLLTAVPLFAQIVSAGAPEIGVIAPSSGQAGTPVTISGARFSDRCSVRFGPEPAMVEGRHVTTLVAIAPANVAGTVDVTVTCGALQATKARAFTYPSPRHRAAR